MNVRLLINLWIFLCSLGGSIYGFYRFFRPRKALYLKIITGGVSCLMLSSLFLVVYLFTQGELQQDFHVGMIGLMASFLFLFSANFGQMDGLADDRTDAYKKTRLISFLAPLMIFGFYTVFCLVVNALALRVSVGLVTIFILPASYYHFKHIIIYDVKLGIVRQLRLYNVLGLLYAVCTMLQFIGLYADIRPLYIASGIAVGVVAALILPVLKRGVDKWIM